MDVKQDKRAIWGLRMQTNLANGVVKGAPQFLKFGVRANEKFVEDLKASMCPLVCSYLFVALRKWLTNRKQLVNNRSEYKYIEVISIYSQRDRVDQMRR